MVSKKLHSEFKFGFEFEGFARIEKFLGNIENYNYNVDNWNDLRCNSLYEDDFRTLYDNVNDFINQKLNSYKGRTHYDGSVKDYLHGYQSFEYSSPVFSFTPKNIKLIKDFFINMNNYGFGINDTCGFHTHISFPQINEMDAMWIVSQIAIDENKIKEICYMNGKDDIIDFYSERYANKSFLTKLGNAIKDKNFINITELLNGDKYRVLRVHPQGTIEWRGPRNFLNLENGINLFINKLSTVIDILSSSLNASFINGLSKKEFFDKIAQEKKFVYFSGYKFSPKAKRITRSGRLGLTDKFGNEETIDNVSNMCRHITKNIVKNPSELLSVDNEPFLNTIIKFLKADNKINKICETLSSNKIYFDDIDKQIAFVKLFPSCIKIMSKEAFDKIDSYDMIHIMENIELKSQRTDELYERVKHILQNINEHLLYDCSLSFINNASWTISTIIELAKQGYFKNVHLGKIYSRYCRNYNLCLNLAHSNIFPYTPIELHSIICDLIENNLTIDIRGTASFDYEYQKTQEDFPSFFSVDILRSSKLNSIPNFELVMGELSTNESSVESVELPLYETVEEDF